MTTPAHDIGDLRRLSVLFKDLNDVATDPTTIIFKIREPDGVLTTFTFGVDAELVKVATGSYHLDFAITKTGRHAWRFEGTGSLQAAEGAEFFARRTEAA